MSGRKGYRMYLLSGFDSQKLAFEALELGSSARALGIPFQRGMGF